MNNNSFCGTQLQSVIVNHHSFYSRTWTHTDLCYVPEVPSFNNSLVDGVSGIKEMQRPIDKERFCPEVQPLTLLYTIPSIDKWYPFHMASLTSW